MSRLYIQYFECDSVKGWGLFYDDIRGVRQPHKEDWKHVVFNTKVEAEAKLALISAEREREDSACPFTLDEAKEYAESHKWKFASTYAKTAPHEYLVKSWLAEEDRVLYERFVATMKANAVIGYYFGHKNHYLILGDHYYWFMGQHENTAVDLINRTTIDYLELRDGVYYYKPKNIGEGE